MDKLDEDDHVLMAFAIAICSFVVFLSIIPTLYLTIKNKRSKGAAKTEIG